MKRIRRLETIPINIEISAGQTVSHTVHHPSSTADMCEIVREGVRQGQAIFPRGGGTMLEFGLPCARSGIVLDLTGLDQVIDYPARDMTITVPAGITIAKLQAVLAQENQRLPIDVPLPEQATLGGAIACNVSGPRRYGYGTLRDYVIGISVVNDRGEEVKAGGRVVKNVAGYDLCKLHIGALGTLGIIMQVTLKVLPRPEALALVRCACPPGALGEILERALASSTRPVCLDVHDEPGSAMPMNIFIGYEGNRAVVDWQVQRLQEELGSGLKPVVRRDSFVEREFRVLTETVGWSAFPLTFRANILPSAVPEFILAARSFGQLAVLHAQAGSGIITGHFREGTGKEEAKPLIGALRERAAAAEGSLVLTRCPDPWKAELNVWGEPRGDWELMRRVKQQLDPKNIFNPGRFVSGI